MGTTPRLEGACCTKRGGLRLQDQIVHSFRRLWTLSFSQTPLLARMRHDGPMARGKSKLRAPSQAWNWVCLAWANHGWAPGKLGDEKRMGDEVEGKEV